MRLLDRYLLRELLGPFAYCLSGFLIFSIAVDLLDELANLQKLRLQAMDVLEYYAVRTPELIVIIMPVALLLALLYTLTNLGRHQEITAIRAAGVSLWRLCLPYLAVGFFASLFLFALNELWVPDSAEATERIRSRHQTPKPGAPGPEQVRNLGVVNAREGRRWQIGLYNVKTAEMRQIQVFWTLADGSTRWLDAERAVRLNGAGTFYHGSEQKGVPG